MCYGWAWGILERTPRCLIVSMHFGPGWACGILEHTPRFLVASMHFCSGWACGILERTPLCLIASMHFVFMRPCVTATIVCILYPCADASLSGRINAFRIRAAKTIPGVDMEKLVAASEPIQIFCAKERIYSTNHTSTFGSGFTALDFPIRIPASPLSKDCWKRAKIRQKFTMCICHAMINFHAGLKRSCETLSKFS